MVFCHVNTSVAQPLTVNANTVIAFDNVVEDTMGAYNTSNGRYTAKKAGLYQITIAMFVSGTPASGLACVADIFKNGSVLLQAGAVGLSATGGNGTGSSSMTAIVRMNGSTDYVQGGAATNFTSASTIASSPTTNFMQIVRLGA